MHTVHLELATQYSHAAGCSANMMLEGVRNKLSIAIVANIKMGTGMISWLFWGPLQESFDPVVSTLYSCCS